MIRISFSQRKTKKKNQKNNLHALFPAEIGAVEINRRQREITFLPPHLYSFFTSFLPYPLLDSKMNKSKDFFKNLTPIYFSGYKSNPLISYPRRYAILCVPTDCASPSSSYSYWPSNSSRKMGSIPRSPSTREAQRSRPTHKDSLLPSLPTKSNGTCILSGALYGVADELKRIGFVYELFIYCEIVLYCAYRAWFYCKACHEDIKDETLIKKCKCKNCKSNYFSLFLDTISFDLSLVSSTL